MKKRSIAIIMTFILLAGILSGCAGETQQTETSAPETNAEPVTLTVAGSWEDCRALDEVARAFTAQYPNCTIVYEYVQEYSESVVKRMEGDKPFDLFFCGGIQSDSEYLPYALDLNSVEELDLSNTFDGLIENALFREESGVNTKLYSIPLGGEMRGIYVNITLLQSLGLEVPTNQAELLNCCAVLKENGYIPFGSNPGSFAQRLVYPWIASSIANAEDPEAMWNTIEACEPGMSELFRDQYQFLYTLVENDYYDYKTAQTDYGFSTDASSEGAARDFFNIRADGDTYAKADDLGMIAFISEPLSGMSTFEKMRDDYHSGIEFTFIAAPVGPDGGYAYLSPAHCITAYKDSENLEWVIKFLDFFFTPENNEIFAEMFGIIPNTKDALSYMAEQFNLPSDHVCELGQVTFTYGFYTMLQESLVNVSKANNPKYMNGYVENGPNDNLTLYPLQYYMDQLEAAIKEQ